MIMSVQYEIMKRPQEMTINIKQSAIFVAFTVVYIAVAFFIAERYMYIKRGGDSPQVIKMEADDIYCDVRGLIVIQFDTGAEHVLRMKKWKCEEILPKKNYILRVVEMYRFGFMEGIRIDGVWLLDYYKAVERFKSSSLIMLGGLALLYSVCMLIIYRDNRNKKQ